MKKIIIVNIMALLIFCIIFISAFASSFSISSIFSTAESKGLDDAVFERGGEICYFDSDDKSISILAGGGKYVPVLSPDKEKIVYQNSVFAAETSIMQFGIIDINGEFINEIVVDSFISNEITGCMWLSDSTVGVTAHVNPSTEEYFVYNIYTGEMLRNYVGYSFAKLPNSENMIYAKNVPHWADEPMYHSFMINDEIVYTSEVLGATLGTPIFSDDSAKIAFVEDLSTYDDFHDSGKEAFKQSIIIADFSEDDMTIHDSRRITVPSEIVGFLSFDQNNSICVVNNNLLQKYDEKRATFISTEITTDFRDSAIDASRFSDLFTIVNEHWGDDSLEYINNINWTSNSK
jgi:hypothetical protein